MRFILAISISLLSFNVLMSPYAILAQTTNTPDASSADAKADNTIADEKLEDSAILQGRVLTKINRALSLGKVNSDQANLLESELNAISGRESFYKSADETVPQSIIDQDVIALHDLCRKIDKEIASPPVQSFIRTENVGIHKMITQAMVKNKISELEAVQYYSRLAQIESDVENVQSSTDASNGDLQSLKKQLDQLKTELEKKLAH